MFCEVERSYIEDGFNLYGLRASVSNFSDCLDLILDRIGPDDSDESKLTQSACTLYGLIHARYIITAHGLDAMYNKVRKCVLLIDCVFYTLLFIYNSFEPRICHLLFFRCLYPSTLQRNSVPAPLRNAWVSQYFRLA